MFERAERNYRRTQLHGCARRGVQHPHREDGARAIGHFADGYLLAAPMLAIRDLDDGAEGRVPWVVHLCGAYSDRGTINGDLS